MINGSVYEGGLSHFGFLILMPTYLPLTKWKNFGTFGLAAGAGCLMAIPIPMIVLLTSFNSFAFFAGTFAIFAERSLCGLSD